MADVQKTRGVHRFAVAISCCTILLLMAGALVTSNDAGLAVPDWPLSYGSLFPPMVAGIFYEHGHRLVATAIGILTIILAVLLQRREPRRWVRNLGWGALGLIVAQGILGGITVLYLLPPAVSTAHATLAQFFFVTVVSLSLFTSNWWQRDLPILDDAGSPGLRPIAAWTTAAIFVQLILGAGFRHNAFGIVPHLAGAVVVTFLVIWTGRTVRKKFGQVRDLRRWNTLLQAFLGTQILLGVAAYWVVVTARDAVQPTPLYVTVTVAHVLVGALTFASSILLTLSCFRLLRQAAAIAVHSRAQGVTR